MNADLCVSKLTDVENDLDELECTYTVTGQSAVTPESMVYSGVCPGTGSVPTTSLSTDANITSYSDATLDLSTGTKELTVTVNLKESIVPDFDPALPDKTHEVSICLVTKITTTSGTTTDMAIDYESITLQFTYDTTAGTMVGVSQNTETGIDIHAQTYAVRAFQCAEYGYAEDTTPFIIGALVCVCITVDPYESLMKITEILSIQHSKGGVVYPGTTDMTTTDGGITVRNCAYVDISFFDNADPASTVGSVNVDQWRRQLGANPNEDGNRVLQAAKAFSTTVQVEANVPSTRCNILCRIRNLVRWLNPFN